MKAKKEGAKALTPKGKEKVPGGGEKVGEKQETETTTGQQQQQGVSPKLFAPFFEVRAAQTHSASPFNFFVRPIGTDQYVVFLVFLFYPLCPEQPIQQ